MATNDGGPAFNCARCAEPAARYQGRQWLCAKHYRFGQMRAMAKRSGKEVPSPDLLEQLAGHGLDCVDCGVAMNWLAKEGAATVVTLQHYRDGAMSLVCLSCNTRHAFSPGDSFRDQPREHKFCPRCGEVKPFAAYSADNSRSGPMKLKSWCRACSSNAYRAWRTQKPTDDARHTKARI